MNALQREYERRLEVGDIRERFASGLLSDLKQFGEAEFYRDGKKERLTFSEVVEHFDCDLDDILKAFFMSPNNEKFTAHALKNAMYEKADDLCQQIAASIYA